MSVRRMTYIGCDFCGDAIEASDGDTAKDSRSAMSGDTVTIDGKRYDRCDRCTMLGRCLPDEWLSGAGS